MFVKKATKFALSLVKTKGVVVLTALPKVNKVVVEGNIIKKHQCPTETLKVQLLKKKLQLLTFKFWTKTVLLDVLATNL